MDYEMIKTLAKIVNEAEVLKKMARDALNSIPIKNYEEYIKYCSAKSSEKTVTSFNDCHISDFTFPHHIDEIKKDPLSVQEYCKENRCWAAKDRSGAICIFKKGLRPRYDFQFGVWAGLYDGFLFSSEFSFPDVPWDKSLIAPDGRLILIEGKKQKKPKEAKFKAGKWYKNKTNNSMVYCKDVIFGVIGNNIIKISGIDNQAEAVFCVSNLSDWYEMKHYNPNKKKKDTGLKRGEPVFVWDNNDSPNLPAIVVYFYKPSNKGCFVFQTNINGMMGGRWDNYRKFDPRLVGVPRKDWEEMPYA